MFTAIKPFWWWTGLLCVLVGCTFSSLKVFSHFLQSIYYWRMHPNLQVCEPLISLLVSRITCCNYRECVQIFWGEASFQAPPLVFPLREMVFVGIREDLLLRGGGCLLSHGSQWYCGLLFPPYSICPIVSILKVGTGISQCLLVVFLPFHSDSCCCLDFGTVVRAICRVSSC